MGIFSKIFNTDKEKEEVKINLDVYAPINGNLIDIEKVEDDTFANKFLGDGLAISPSKTEYILAPIDGIVDITPTNHAFTITNEQGVELLVHFGLDTVKLNGKGFEALVKSGDRVSAKDKIIKCDYEYIVNNAPSLVSPIIVMDAEKYCIIKEKIQEVNAGVNKIYTIEK